MKKLVDKIYNEPDTNGFGLYAVCNEVFNKDTHGTGKFTFFPKNGINISSKALEQIQDNIPRKLFCYENNIVECVPISLEGRSLLVYFWVIFWGFCLDERGKGFYR